MTFNLVSLKKDVIKNDIYINELKEMEISTFLTERPYTDETLKYLDTKDLKYVHELTDLTIEEVEDRISDELKTNYEKNRYINKIKTEMHSIGLIFKDEFKDVDIQDNMASIRLECIENFPGGARTKNALYRSKIYILGDLINCEYQSIINSYPTQKKIRNLGKKMAQELIEYIHSIGYRFKNEEQSQDYIKEQYKKENEQLLGDVIESSFICSLLYRKGIYTINQLKDSKINLYELPGIGKERRKEVNKILRDLNISTKTDIKEDNSFEENCKIVEKIFGIIKTSNTEQKQKLELLEKEYNELLEEKILLTEKEIKLEKAIQDKKEEKNNANQKRKYR